VRKPLVIGCLVIPITLFLIAWAAWAVFAYQFAQGRIPERIEVTETLFQREESWGFGGPGDNETGLVVFALDEASARRLIEAGPRMNDPASIAAAMGPAESLRLGAWQRGTILDDAGQPLRISEFLDKWGFGITIPDTTAREVDQILASNDIYHASGSGGALIIVAPAARRVVFAYAG
jgi:hypothetical protein